MDIDAAFVLEDFESLSALQKRNISSNKLFEYVKKINIAYASSCEEIARLNSEIVSLCSRNAQLKGEVQGLLAINKNNYRISAGMRKTLAAKRKSEKKRKDNERDTEYRLEKLNIAERALSAYKQLEVLSVRDEWGRQMYNWYASLVCPPCGPRGAHNKSRALFSHLAGVSESNEVLKKAMRVRASCDATGMVPRLLSRKERMDSLTYNPAAIQLIVDTWNECTEVSPDMKDIVKYHEQQPDGN